MTTVSTGALGTLAGHHIAVMHAAEAARRITDRYEGAEEIEFAQSAEAGIEPYDLFLVLPAADSDDHLWADYETGKGGLTDDDVDYVQSLLTWAGDALDAAGHGDMLDFQMVVPGELGGNSWRMSLPLVLTHDLSAAVGRLVGLVERLGLGRRGALDAVVGDVDHTDQCCATTVSSEEQADDINDAGVFAQARFLIRHLGEREAWSAVELIAQGVDL